MQPAIRVENLSKRYRLGATRVDNNLTENLKAGLGRVWRGLTGRKKAAATESNDFWALKDVSFEVKPGEVVGIIGRNGAGKSTLLKVLSRIVEPTGGRATVRGRMGSLLEVGTGFHPELTGRENIYLNGSILGMSQKEIAKKFDEIVAFSEIEKFLDTPVKRYSSGMYVRLAFAVASQLEPEILVVDEVLAVGDQSFQQKCTRRMRAVGEHGRTILFVSHNMAAVQNLCTRCVWLKSGIIVADGPTAEVLDAYRRDMADATGSNVDLTEHRGRTSNSVRTMQRVRVSDDNDSACHAVPMRGTARIEVAFRHTIPIADVALGLVVRDQYGNGVFTVNSKVTQCPDQTAPLSEGLVVCRLPELPLMPGVYAIDLFFGTRVRDFDVVCNAAELTVLPADVFGTGKLPPSGHGSVCWPATWEVLPSNLTKVEQ